jgi:hypothetical protein
MREDGAWLWGPVEGKKCGPDKQRTSCVTVGVIDHGISNSYKSDSTIVM